MSEPFEIIRVDTPKVACNGGGGALGHPRIYLNLGAEHRIQCPYCSRLYVLESAALPHVAAEAQANPSRAT